MGSKVMASDADYEQLLKVGFFMLSWTNFSFHESIAQPTDLKAFSVLSFFLSFLDA